MLGAGLSAIAQARTALILTFSTLTSILSVGEDTKTLARLREKYRVRVPDGRPVAATQKDGGCPTRSAKLKEPLIKSHAVATVAIRDGMREVRRSQWPPPLASRATKQTARKATVPPGCGKMRRLRRCAPRLRSPSYDLRRAPSSHPHFAGNAIRGGLNQRSLRCCCVNWYCPPV